MVEHEKDPLGRFGWIAKDKHGLEHPGTCWCCWCRTQSKHVNLAVGQVGHDSDSLRCLQLAHRPGSAGKSLDGSALVSLQAGLMGRQVYLAGAWLMASVSAICCPISPACRNILSYLAWACSLAVFLPCCCCLPSLPQLACRPAGLLFQVHTGGSHSAISFALALSDVAQVAVQTNVSLRSPHTKNLESRASPEVLTLHRCALAVSPTAWLHPVILSHTFRLSGAHHTFQKDEAVPHIKDFQSRASARFRP